jgi:hypothetical protein
MDEDEPRLYLPEVWRGPRLRPFQQHCLFQELEHDGPQAELARTRLIEANLRLAVMVPGRTPAEGCRWPHNVEQLMHRDDLDATLRRLDEVYLLTYT